MDRNEKRKINRMKRLVPALILVLVLVFVLSSCTTYNSFKGTFIDRNVAESEPTITIGVFEPVTGRNAARGTEELKGIELANSIYNNVDGYKVVLSKVDTQSSVSAAKTAVQGLIEMKPVAIIGSAGEATSLAASELIEKASIPTITPSATNPLITQGNIYYFRASITESQMGQGLAEYGLFEGAVKCSLDKSTDLSNGDEITLSYEIDNEFLKEYRLKFTGKGMKKEVEGLQEIETFDAFKNLELTYDGKAPDGEVYLSGGEDWLNYTASPSEHLSNGDKIVVTVSYSNVYPEEDYINKFKRVPQSYTKEYVVEGLSGYVTKISEINDSTYASIDRTVQSIIQKNINDNTTIANKDAIKEVAKEGVYLLTTSDFNNYSWFYNKLVVVYKVSYKTATADKSYYYYVIFHNLDLTADGTISLDLNNYDAPLAYTYTWLDEAYADGDFVELEPNVYATGFDSIDKIYDICVLPDLSSYQMETDLPQQ